MKNIFEFLAIIKQYVLQKGYFYGENIVFRYLTLTIYTFKFFHLCKKTKSPSFIFFENFNVTIRKF